MQEDWLACLNSEQRHCVEHEGDVLQILAGPGSGKTRVLTTRIAYAVARRGIAPESIVVVTFTNKAARELTDRLAAILGEGISKRLIVGTFHAVSLRYLQRYGRDIGLPEKILVADAADSKNVIAKALKQLRKASAAAEDDASAKQLTPAAVMSHISGLKSRSVDVDALRKTVHAKNCPLKLGAQAREEVLTLYELYERHLRDHGLLDFDDLILHGIRLLRELPDVVGRVQSVFVDEFQDTSGQQFELMARLCRARGRLTVVGDHDQSIYGFRAADIENFRKMHATFRDCIEVHLKSNYRSSGAIVFAASSLIEQDCARPAKMLEPIRRQGRQPTLRCLETAQTEADWLATEIRRIVGAARGLFDEDDIAILVRSASLTLPIEQALQRHQIRYRMVNARKFLERPHIRPLIAYLRVVQEPSSPTLLQIVNVPPRKFGDASLEALQAEALARRTSAWQVIRDVARGSCKLGKKNDAKLEARLAKLVSAIDYCRAKIEREPDCSMTELLAVLIDRIEWPEYLKTMYPEDWKDRIDDVEQFKATADILGSEESQSWDTAGTSVPVAADDQAETSLDRLLNALTLMSDAGDGSDNAANKRCVSITTIHSAKGLEWPCVFVPGCYGGSLPSSRAVEAGEVDEERRLLYVAMTRAQALLYLSHPKRSARGERVDLSCFLDTSNMSHFLTPRGPRCDAAWITETAEILGRLPPAAIGLESVASALDGAAYRLNLEDSYVDRQASTMADEDYDVAFENGKFIHRPSSASGFRPTLSRNGSSSAGSMPASRGGPLPGFSSARVLSDMPEAQLARLQNRPVSRTGQPTLKRSSSSMSSTATFAPAGDPAKVKPALTKQKTRPISAFFAAKAETTPASLPERSIVATKEVIAIDDDDSMLPQLQPAASGRAVHGGGSLMQRSQRKDEYKHVYLSSSPERPAAEAPAPLTTTTIEGDAKTQPPKRKKTLGARPAMSMMMTTTMNTIKTTATTATMSRTPTMSMGTSTSTPRLPHTAPFRRPGLSGQETRHEPRPLPRD